MRDPNRIPKLCSLLSLAWLDSPDSRLCQLVDSAAHLGGWRQQDIFHCEDDALEKGLEVMLGPRPITTTLIENYTYLVMRRPSVQEDEGRYSVAATFDSLVAAELWVYKETDDDPHYSRDFFIVRD